MLPFTGGVSSSLHDNMKLFFNPSEPHFFAWVRKRNYVYETISMVYPRLRNPLQYIAQLGFRSLVESLLHTGPRITGVHSEFVNSQLGVTAAAIDASIYAMRILFTKTSKFPICNFLFTDSQAT